MGQAIGELLPLAVGVALSPIPIIAVVLMLGTPRGRVNGPAFLGGWILGLVAAGTIVLLATGGAGASEGGAPATWTGWLKLVLGVALVLGAVRRWRGRPRGDGAPEMPGWMRTVDRFTAGRAVAMAVALSAVNPKNLLLTAAAATAIAQLGLTTGQQAGSLAVFVLIATLGPALPVAIYFGAGARAPEILDGLKAWLAAHNAAIVAVLLLVIGAKLIGDGISVLSL